MGPHQISLSQEPGPRLDCLYTPSLLCMDYVFMDCLLAKVVFSLIVLFLAL